MSRMPVDERRAQLLELGIRIFGSDRSYDAISIDEIAERAGISKGLLYRYFPNKREFYVETVRAQAFHMSELTRMASPQAGLDGLAKGLDAYLTYVEDHAAGYSAFLRSGIGADEEVREIVEESRKDTVKRIVRALGIRRPSAIVRGSLRGWIGLLEGLCLDWLDHGDVKKADISRIAIIALAALLEFKFAPPRRTRNR